MLAIKWDLTLEWYLVQQWWRQFASISCQERTFPQARGCSKWAASNCSHLKVNCRFEAETRPFPGSGAWARLPVKSSPSWPSLLWGPFWVAQDLLRSALPMKPLPAQSSFLPILFRKCQTPITVQMLFFLSPASPCSVLHWTFLMGDFGSRTLHWLARYQVGLCCNLRLFLPTPLCFSLSITGGRPAET